MIPKEKLEQMNVKLTYDKIVRNILVNKPRVTQFSIPWAKKENQTQLIQKMQLGQMSQNLPTGFLGDVNYKETINNRFQNLFGS